MTRFVVAAEADGDRLDVALAAALDVSRNQAAARIQAGEVTIDGAPAAKQRRVRAGEQVEVAARAPAPTVPAPPAPPVRYADEHLLVVAKPAGLVVHRGPGHDGGTLVDALLAAGVSLATAAGVDRPGIVHRLDRDTSGLMVVARTDEAYAGMVAALRRRDVERVYLTLVAGTPRAATGRIEAPIGRDPRDRKRFAVVPDGKAAVTRYRTVAVGAAATAGGGRAAVSLLRCRLETGRTHQIRVHLTALGHPVVGDPTYGRSGRLAAALGLERPFLHAARIGFDHPVTGVRVELVEPLPAELAASLDRVGLGAHATEAGS